MKCPKCQFKNPEDSKFCLECGQKFEQKCPQCEKSLPIGAKFCNDCGYNLGEPSETPPINYDQPQTYTPKHLTDKILKTRNALKGERKLVTVLFADVANYTAMSENLDPEEVHQIMDGCYHNLIEQVHCYEGTINQFTGDGIMALFGAPIAHEDHAQRACHASLAIQEALVDYSEELSRSHGIDFNMRIGLNSGLVFVGAIGDDLQMDYTAIGDTVNLASRMESMATPGGILTSDNTYRLVRDFFEFESLGKIEVKGKKEPLEAFRLIKAGAVATRIGASAARGLTRFVGRKRELDTIREVFEKTKSGRGQVVGVVGEAGVGKSRLLLELRYMLPQGEYTSLEGRCLHYGVAMPYLPILDTFKSYIGIKEGEQERLIKKRMNEKFLGLDENLMTAIPPLQELLSLKPDDESYAKLEPKQKRKKTFEALRSLLVRVSQDRPLILAIEDLHWIDKTSEEFLDYMVDWLSNTHILLILLYRPEYTHQWGSKSHYSKIGVDRLSAGAGAELVRAILEGGEVTPEIRKLILGRASGNPFFMEELVRNLVENGSILKKEDRYVLKAKSEDIQVPDTVQGIIAARIDRLEENLKRIMQVASVIGREFAFRILNAISEINKDLKSSLLNLQGLEFIYEKSLIPEIEYIFRHALTQEVAYNSLLLKRRKKIHEKIGRAIEKLYHERLEEFYEMLAYHYSKSDNLENAHLYLKLSGNKATGKHSSWEAIRFYEDAINVLDQLPDTETNKKEKLEVIHLTTFPMLHLGYPEDFFWILQEGERLSNELKDTRSLAILYGRMGSYYAYIGKPLIGIKYAENAFKEARKIQDIELMAPVAFELCAPYIGSGEFLKIIDIARSVIELIEKNRKESDFFGKDINVYSGLCARCGGIMAYLGNFEKGKKLLEKGLLNATQIGDPRALAIVELYSGHLFLFKGEWELSKAHYENCIKYSEETKWTMLLSLARSGFGYAYAHLGDPETACKHIEKGLMIQNEAGIEWWLSLHYCFLSIIYFRLGDLKSALSFIKKALDLSQRNNEKMVVGLSWIWLGRISGKADPLKRDMAEESILQGIKIFNELKLKPFYSEGYLYLGELYTDTGRNEKALASLKKAEKMFREMGMDYWCTQVQAALDDL